MFNKIKKKWFKWKLKRFLERSEVKFATDQDIQEADHALIVVQRVTDYPLSKNSFFDNDANKSYPREGIECMECHFPCVMSNKAFEMHSARKNSSIVCMRCVAKVTRGLIK